MSSTAHSVPFGIQCKHCGEKQIVLVREGTGFTVSPTGWIKCVYCGEEFRPDTIVGEILKGPYRPQDMRYAYAAITCKSCGYEMTVDYLGPYLEGSEIPSIPQSSGEGGLEKACQRCSKSHYYKHSEMTVTLRSQLPHAPNS